MCRWLVAVEAGIILVLLGSGVASAESANEGINEGINESISLPSVRCEAQQTGGFHDYPEGEETYEPALFHPQKFALEENLIFMMNLAGGEGNADLYLTMTRDPSGDEQGSSGQAAMDEVSELECRSVRGANGDMGFSCVNLPPSEMILINARTLRYTRTAVGGWTFAGASGELNGDSIFVEYGQCAPVQSASGPPAESAQR